MRIVIVSDTHNLHRNLGRLNGDVLIHCGDMFDMFDNAEASIDAMDSWFGEQDFAVVLCTGGNHDTELQSALEYSPQPFRNAVYLEGDSYVHNGLKFWGAPWTPDLPGHAFYKSAREIKAAWTEIPADTDVLITHTPPRSILDVSSSGATLGCAALLGAVTRIRPQVHCFGHVHHSRGMKVQDETRYINASSVGRNVNGTHPATFIEI